jgi:hypothetical protein
MSDIDWPPVLILQELDFPLLGEWKEGKAIFKVPRSFYWSHDATMWVDADLQGNKFAMSVSVVPATAYNILEGDFINVTLNFELDLIKNYK